MSKTLLEKAKELKMVKKSRYSCNKEEIDVAIAWAKGELTLKQVAYGLNKKYSGNVIYYVALLLREALKIGKLKETK